MEKVRCPSASCGDVIEVPVERLGRNVYCLTCGTRMTARPLEVDDELREKQDRVHGGKGLEIPRLREKSLSFVRRQLIPRLTSGQPFSPAERTFAIFGVLSMAWMGFAIFLAVRLWGQAIFDLLAALVSQPAGVALLVLLAALLVLGWLALRWRRARA